MGHRRKIFVLAALCVLAYIPALSLPLFEDDFPLISFSDESGPLGVLSNPVFRVRATSCWVMIYLWRAVHHTPFVYHAASLLLHVANTLLVFGIGLSWPRIRPAAFWCAAFFAVAEGHQEAIMWFAAISELLQFLFGAGSLLALLRGRVVISAACFGLALLSKESAVIWLPLFGLAAYEQDCKQTLRRLAPHAALAAAAVLSIALTRQYNFRLADGSFSLSAPFVAIWFRNVARMLWIWGWIALAFAAWKFRGTRSLLVRPLLWIGIGLMPYCFLTYSRQIPSRQTYLASAGLAFLFGHVFERIHKHRLAAAVAAVVLLHNLGILWIKKRAQFVQRAEPTEQLIRLARETDGPIHVRCFPRPGLIASEAVRLAAGRPPSVLVWNETEALGRSPKREYCFRER